jgi:Amt family ammonium transporter
VVSTVNGISGLIEGNARQFLVQCAGVLICGAYSFAVTYVMLKVINVFTPVRVPEEAEQIGLDVVLHGETAYEFGTN